MWALRVRLVDLVQQEVKFALQVTPVKMKSTTCAPRQLVFGNEGEGSRVRGELSRWTTGHEDITLLPFWFFFHRSPGGQSTLSTWTKDPPQL